MIGKKKRILVRLTPPPFSLPSHFLVALYLWLGSNQFTINRHICVALVFGSHVRKERGHCFFFFARLMRSAWKTGWTTVNDKKGLWTTNQEWADEREWENRFCCRSLLFVESNDWNQKLNVYRREPTGDFWCLLTTQISLSYVLGPPYEERCEEKKNKSWVGWSTYTNTKFLNSSLFLTKTRNLPTATDALFGAKRNQDKNMQRSGVLSPKKTKTKTKKVWGLVVDLCLPQVTEARRGPGALM